MTNTLVVKCTTGLAENEIERCNQALLVSATAAASGIPVSLWLSGEAVLLGLPGRAAELCLPFGRPGDEMLSLVLETGQVSVCGQCAQRREITPELVLPGVRIAGAATFLHETLQDNAKVLVY